MAIIVQVRDQADNSVLARVTWFKSKCEAPEQISDELKFDKVLIRSTAGNVFDRRRKSDCPARHKAGVKLSQSLGPASQRVKSKSIERAVDIELSSHHLATSAANQKLNNIGNLILNLSGKLLVRK